MAAAEFDELRPPGAGGEKAQVPTHISHVATLNDTLVDDHAQKDGRMDEMRNSRRCGRFRRRDCILAAPGAAIVAGVSVSIAAFLAIRDLDRTNAVLEARRNEALVIDLVEDQVVDIKGNMRSLELATSIALTHASSAANVTRYKDLGRFLSSVQFLTFALKVFQEGTPAIRTAVCAPTLAAEDVPLVQRWLEDDVLGVASGGLNMTTSTHSGARVAPPAAPTHNPIVYLSNVDELGSSLLMLDLASAPSRAPLINHTRSTGELAASEPVPILGVQEETEPHQLLYQSVAWCDPTPAPRAPCAPRAAGDTHALALLAAALDVEAMLQSMLL